MKTCTRCFLSKEKSEFYTLQHTKDKLASRCKACVKECAKLFAINNPQRRREISLASDARNREHKKKYSKEYRLKTASINNEKQKQRKLRHPEKYAHYENLRRARKLKATPLWANLEYIKIFYFLAKEEEKRLQVKVHVDHIVPLRSKLVCGLHNEFNLQLLTQKQNSSKLNYWWPDMPQKEERNLK